MQKCPDCHKHWEMTWNKIEHCPECGQTKAQATKKAERNKVSEQWERLVCDAAALSSGTIASLAGASDYPTIEHVQGQFVHFCQTSHGDHPGGFTNWQEAWAIFAKEVLPKILTDWRD